MHGFACLLFCLGFSEHTDWAGRCWSQSLSQQNSAQNPLTPPLPLPPHLEDVSRCGQNLIARQVQICIFDLANLAVLGSGESSGCWRRHIWA